MADCGYWEYQISLALDGELDADGGDRLTRHLGQCPRCRGVRESLEKSAQAIRTWPDLADPVLMAGLKHDILQKTCRARRKTAWAACLAAALVAAFVAANIWLGPLWQRPVLVAAAVSPGNGLELTFNQPMNAASWPGTGAASGVAAPENGPIAGAMAPSETAPTAKFTMALPQESAPRTNESSAVRPAPTFGPAYATEVPPAYTVTRRGNTILISFAGPRPGGQVRILVPATVRDLWGRELHREYLVVVEHGKVAVTAP